MNSDYQYIVAQLQNALAQDPRVSLLDIKVIVCAGRIHLVGQVVSWDRREAAALVASEVLPDLEIRNEISVIDVAQPSSPEVIR
jgi:hypothetical protein